MSLAKSFGGMIIRRASEIAHSMKKMKNVLFRLFIFTLSGIFLLVQWSCTTKISEEFQENFRTIGIVSAEYQPEPTIEGFAIRLEEDRPPFFERDIGAWEGLKSGAKKGVRKGMEIGAKFHPGAPPPSPIGLALMPLFYLVGLIVGVTVGAAVGTITGGIGGMTMGMMEPEKKEPKKDSLGDLPDLQKTLETYLETLGMQKRFRNEVVTIVGQKPSLSVQELTGGGPSKPNGQIDFLHFQEKGLDLVLVVSIASLGLQGTSKLHKKVQIFMVGKADLWRVADQVLLYRKTVFFQTPSQPYESWAADNARAFEKALNQGYRNLAEQVSTTLFETQLFPHVP